MRVEIGSLEYAKFVKGRYSDLTTKEPCIRPCLFQDSALLRRQRFQRTDERTLGPTDSDVHI